VSLVEEHRDVVRVHPIHGEREDARAHPGVGGAEEVDAGLPRERRRHAGVDRVLLGLDRVEPNPREVVETGMGADDPGVILEARLEPVGRGSQRMSLERRPLHRFPSEEERSQLRERFEGTRQHPGPGRAEHFVGRHRVEVHSHPVELNLLMGRGLTAVEQDQGPAVVRPFGDLPDRKRVTVQVRGMEQAHQTDPERKPLLQLGRVEAPVVRERENLDADPSLRGKPLPDDEVRIMFPVGHEDPVAGLPGEPLTDQVDRLRRVPQEDDPARVGAPEEAGEGSPGRLVPAAYLLGEPMEATAGAAGEIPIVFRHGLEDHGRHERHAGGVEVDRGPSVASRLEGGELGSDLGDVHGAAR